MTSQEFIFSNDENKLSEKPQTKLLKSKIILKQKQSLLILIDQAFLNNHEAATGGMPNNLWIKESIFWWKEQNNESEIKKYFKIQITAECYLNVILSRENSHRREKYHCTADPLVDWFGFDQTGKEVTNTPKTKQVNQNKIKRRSVSQW